MKTTLARVLLLAVVLALVLSGCGQNASDMTKAVSKAMKEIDKEYSTVVAKYNGGEVTVGEMMNDFNYAYTENYYMYAYYFGMEMTEEDIRSIAESTMVDFTEGEIVAAHFDAEHTLSEEELAELDEIVKEEYEYNLEYAIESAEGETEEEKKAYAELLLRQNGVDEASMRLSYGNYFKRENMREILRSEITEVPENEIRAAYDQYVEENKADYVNGIAFESDMTDESAVICWKPEGYRTVKHILVFAADENQTAYQEALAALEEKELELSDLYEEMQLDSADAIRTPDEVQADIAETEKAVADCEAVLEVAKAACLNDVKEQTDEIYARLENGEDFNDLIAEYGQDPGMQGGITAEMGYCVAENSIMWEPNFRDAAMALENVGDYTMEPVLSGSGVHIIRYEADVTPGEVGYENARDALYESALSALQDAHADEVIVQWVAEADPKYDLEKFMKVLYG